VEGVVTVDRTEFPLLDGEQARRLLAEAYQAAREGIGLHERLRDALDRGDLTEAQYLNDAVFLALNDLAQRFEQAIGRGA
jgi:hypothetical protein